MNFGLANFNANASTFAFANEQVGLQQVAFIDVGLFEEDLTLYGVIGNGVALALAQCEEVEGCAPDVSEAELDELIEGLKVRIQELERRLEDGDGDRARIEELLEGYRQELENFEGYKKDLEEYYSSDFDEDDDDFGEEDELQTKAGQIQRLSEILEVAQRRIEWLESLKGDADARAKLSEGTGIELTIEAIDSIIEATRQEVIIIERQIQNLQDGTEAMSRPVFWAETGDYNGVQHLGYGASLLNIGVESLASHGGMY